MKKFKHIFNLVLILVFSQSLLMASQDLIANGEQQVDKNQCLRYMGLLVFPKILLETPHITSIDLSNNCLKKLPNLRGLFNLKVLGLQSNLLNDQTIFRLPKDLDLIDLDHNKFTKFPNFFGCVALRFISISSNRIESLPLDLSLPNLNRLNILDNPVSSNRSHLTRVINSGDLSAHAMVTLDENDHIYRQKPDRKRTDLYQH